MLWVGETYCLDFAEYERDKAREYYDGTPYDLGDGGTEVERLWP